jgi:vacuolar-type H+-ATPase subunit I/STV1
MTRILTQGRPIAPLFQEGIMAEDIKSLTKKIAELEKRLKFNDNKIKALADNMTDSKSIEKYVDVLQKKIDKDASKGRDVSEKAITREIELVERATEAREKARDKDYERENRKWRKEGEKAQKDMEKMVKDSVRQGEMAVIEGRLKALEAIVAALSKR